MGRYVWGEGGNPVYEETSSVTPRYSVNELGTVYNEQGCYFCMWAELTESEKAKIRKNSESS
jgi:hypothetical protein